MKVTVKNEQELLKAFSGDLAGCQPAEKMNTEEFIYPVTFEVDTKSKTFKLISTETTTETTTETKSKCKFCPYIFGAVGVVIIVALLLVFL